MKRKRPRLSVVNKNEYSGLCTKKRSFESMIEYQWLIRVRRILYMDEQSGFAWVGFASGAGGVREARRQLTSGC
jgi:hypothetical protein